MSKMRRLSGCWISANALVYVCHDTARCDNPITVGSIAPKRLKQVASENGMAWHWPSVVSDHLICFARSQHLTRRPQEHVLQKTHRARTNVSRNSQTAIARVHKKQDMFCFEEISTARQIIPSH